MPRMRSSASSIGQDRFAVHDEGAEIVAGADAGIGLHQVEQARRSR
jgi:hypothetical protein